MPLDRPGFSRRADLTELMDEPCSRDVLRGCLRDLALTNRLTLAYRPVLHWLNAMKGALPQMPHPLRILDAGCGYGDGLRRIEKWASRHSIAVDLIGLDLNPDATAIAVEASDPTCNIHWVTADVLDYAPPQPVHLIVSSLFTHHLDEDQIVRFIQWMEQHAELGWFINDLARGAVPYHLFRIFSRLARLHPFVQHDGPVSIARSFVPEDWQRICAKAGISADTIRIETFKPARLCVARSKLR
jgi:SAM-dependent methyltransferase